MGLKILKDEDIRDYEAPPSEKLFIDVAKEWFAKESTDFKYQGSTLKRYRYFFNTLEKFIKLAKLDELTIGEIRVKHMETYRTFCMTHLKSCNADTASRFIEMCKRVTRYAQIMEYITTDPLIGIKRQRARAKDVVYLERHEVEMLRRHQFQSFFIQKAVDLYLFQCATGLSFADLWQFEITEVEGKLWLTKKRKKSGVVYTVPFFDEARNIYEKYQRKLPLITNQEMNRNIKEAANVVGITKRLTTHTARKTFATLRDQDGFSPKTISDMLGNSIDVCEKHYLGRSTKRIEKELKALGYDQNVVDSANKPDLKKRLPAGPDHRENKYRVEGQFVNTLELAGQNARD